MKPEVLRRREWTQRRKARGLERPRPLVVRNVNAGSVTFWPARVERIWRVALNKRGRWGRPDLVLATEMADIDAAREGWEVVQFGAVGSPESALVIAARVGRVTLRDVHLVDGSPATDEGGGIRRRPILKGVAVADDGTEYRWVFSLALGHAPPSRAERARSTFLATFAEVRALFKAGDLNIPARWAARLIGGRRVHSAGVLHTAVARRFPSLTATVDVDGDHLAQDTVLWPAPLWRKR